MEQDTQTNRAEPESELAPVLPMVEHLAQQLGEAGNAAAIFGEAVSDEEATVIPVAKVGWGVGGGRKPADEAAGAGGGVGVKPVGFIHLRNGKARFRPIGPPRAVVLLSALAGSGIALAAQALIRRRTRSPNQQPDLRDTTDS